LTSIFPFDVKKLAMELYPTQQNATRNRCVITPVRAIFFHAYERGWGPAIRIRNLKEDTPKRKKAASQAWLHAFVRQCGKDGLQHLAALVLFMSQTGARISEALELRWSEVDLINRTALLLKTKTGQNSTRFLTDQMISRLYALQDGVQPTDRVFRYRNRHSVNERIAAVCRRAGIVYKPTHTCGRHAFANIALSMGVDVKSAMDAGGWKSTAVFLGTYANPRNAGRVVAERLNVYQYDADL
jgi:integrase